MIIMVASSGVQRAFADQSLQGRLISWFDDRRNESIREMDQSFTTEKNRLMNQLRMELQLETQRAQAQLAQHTASETADSIQQLQQYADQLSATIHFSNDSQKAAVSSSIDKALENAKALIQGAAVVPVVPPVVQPEAAKPAPATPNEPPAEQAPVQEPVQATEGPAPVPAPPVDETSSSDTVGGE